MVVANEAGIIAGHGVSAADEAFTFSDTIRDKLHNASPLPLLFLSTASYKEAADYCAL